MAVVTLGLLAISGAMIYATRVGSQANRQTRALQYAKQLMALSKLYNLPRAGPINDSAAARIAVNAPPFEKEVLADSLYTRNIRMAAVSASSSDYRAQLYQVDVTIYWKDRGREVSLHQRAIHRAP